MHRAPVIGIIILDGQSTPLPEPLEVAHDLSKSPNMQGCHQLLVVSEEQLKVTGFPVCVVLYMCDCLMLFGMQCSEDFWKYGLTSLSLPCFQETFSGMYY